MKNGTYKPFTKPNHRPTYVHTQSNHPPSIIKNIPLSVNERLSRLSSNKEIFDAAAPQYQEALDRSWYNHKLEFSAISPTKEPGRCRKRGRRVTYFNPPFSLNVGTNIGKEFLNIIRNFPQNNPLHPSKYHTAHWRTWVLKWLATMEESLGLKLRPLHPRDEIAKQL